MRKITACLMAFLMITSSNIAVVHALGFTGSPKIAVLNALNENVPNVGNVDVLVIDGSWLEGKTKSGAKDLCGGIKKITSIGVPTILVGGDTSFDKIVDDVLVHTVNQPSIVSAVKVYFSLATNYSSVVTCLSKKHWQRL